MAPQNESQLSLSFSSLFAEGTSTQQQIIFSSLFLFQFCSKVHFVLENHFHFGVRLMQRKTWNKKSCDTVPIRKQEDNDLERISCLNFQLDYIFQTLLGKRRSIKPTSAQNSTSSFGWPYDNSKRLLNSFGGWHTKNKNEGPWWRLFSPIPFPLYEWHDGWWLMTFTYDSKRGCSHSKQASECPLYQKYNTEQSVLRYEDTIEKCHDVRLWDG